MTIPLWHEVPISKRFDRKAFDCGDVALNMFLQRHARQSHDRGGAKTFLAIDSTQMDRILGFYSVAPASVAFKRAPESVRQGLARHEIPVFRLARLAVDRSVQGRGLGGQLLLTAGRRCLLVASQVGGVALLIDAKNDRIAQWYAGYGAIPLLDQPLSLILPLNTIQTALNAAGRL